VAKNRINDLRDHLFETIEALKDPEKPMEIARAKAISDVAQTIINSAKVQVEMAKALSASAPGSAAFFDLPESEERERGYALPAPDRPANGQRRNGK
jgi:hypothetical protein